jgi:multidrug efflux pump subunit AcrB
LNAALALSPADVSAAIAAQNVQFASGRIGDLPSPPTQQIGATLIAEGQLTTPEDLGAIVLRAKPDRSRWCSSGDGRGARSRRRARARRRSPSPEDTRRDR